MRHHSAWYSTDFLNAERAESIWQVKKDLKLLFTLSQSHSGNDSLNCFPNRHYLEIEAVLIEFH